MSKISSVTFSHVVFDQVFEADGKELERQLGGAGIYAVAAQALASPHGEFAGVVSGVGQDFSPELRADLSNQGIDTDGLVPLDESTPLTVIRYDATGERVETPAFGMDHFVRLDPRFDLMPKTYLDAQAIYVFDQINPQLFSHLQQSSAHAKILWEAHAHVCTPELREQFVAQANSVDVLSLNRTELHSLFSDDSLASTEQLAVRLGNLTHCVVALRLGAQGAVVIDGSSYVRATPPAGEVMDPTGAGNAFSGAFITGFARTQNLEEAVRDAMAASALTICQYGPPTISENTRTEFAITRTHVDVSFGDTENLHLGKVN